VRDENWAEEIDYDLSDSRAVRDAFLRHFDDWAPELRKLVRVADEEPPPYIANLYQLPVGHRWACKGNVTLLGDSAHVCSPFCLVATQYTSLANHHRPEKQIR